jgi:hypothetical protein
MRIAIEDYEHCLASAPERSGSAAYIALVLCTIAVFTIVGAILLRL